MLPTKKIQPYDATVNLVGARGARWKHTARLEATSYGQNVGAAKAKKGVISYLRI